MIGFAVNIQNSTKTPQEIVDELEDALLISEKQFHCEGDFICGRYAIFFDCQEKTKVIADASTLRKIFYAMKGKIVAGHAKLVSHQLFKGAAENKIFWSEHAQLPFLGIKTPYNNVYMLTSNHTLEIGTGKLNRIFPRETFSPMTEENALELFCAWGRNALKAVELHQEKTLNFALTSGLDSRATFSLADSLAKPYEATTYHTKVLPGNLSHDVPAAIRICEQTGTKHHIVSDEECPIDLSVKSAMEANCYFKYAGLNYYLANNYYKTLGEDRYIIINTNLLEVGRRWAGFEKYHTSSKQFPGNTEYAKSHGVNEEQLLGYNPLQIMFLEQQLSAWLTHFFMYTDLIGDCFNCFNARAILDVMMRSTKVPHQMNWGKIQSKVIENAWYYHLPYSENSLERPY